MMLVLHPTAMAVSVSLVVMSYFVLFDNRYTSLWHILKTPDGGVEFFELILLVDCILDRSATMALVCGNSSEDPCRDYLKFLPGDFDFKFPPICDVIFDRRNRCHSRYFKDEKMTSYRDVNYDWTFENALGLAEEVLGVVHQATDRELGIVNCLPIKSNEEDIGCSLSFMTDTIFIQCGGVRHPFDIVSTVLHEIGHQMVYRTEHECPHKHCVTWSRCCMTIAAVFEQSEKLTPLLRLIEEEYGAEWAKQLVQSDTACTRCPMTAKQRRQQNRLRALTNESKVKCCTQPLSSMRSLMSGTRRFWRKKLMKMKWLRWKMMKLKKMSSSSVMTKRVGKCSWRRTMRWSRSCEDDRRRWGEDSTKILRASTETHWNPRPRCLPNW